MSSLDDEVMSVWLHASLEDLLLPELENIGRWGALIHERLFKNNPQRFLNLSKLGQLKKWLSDEQEFAAAAEEMIARNWREKQRFSQVQSFDELAFWRESREAACAAVTAALETKYCAK